MPRVVVVGLGPAGPDLITAGARAAIDRIPVRFVRTSRHPSTIEGAISFDPVYEQAASMDEVYATIVATLVDGAVEHGEVLYAVPGSPSVAERTVELLRAEPRVEVEVLPALSFLDLVWDRLGVDPVATGVRVVDGHRFVIEAAGERGPLLVVQCDSRDVLSDIKLAVEDPPAEPVVVLQRLGLPDESVRAVPWDAIDREVDADHLTCLWVPQLAAPVGAELVRFSELVRTLRERCPWDREQTHESLVPYAIEETYELVEAIEEGDPEHLEEELGDVLFQVFFHATLAAEAGHFTVADVARTVHDKLVRRHPHVFADVEVSGSGEVVANWQAIKKEEKGRESVMEGIPSALPALMLARKVQNRAAGVGFDWPDVEGPMAKVLEELGELRENPSVEELGDLLFATVNVGRHLGIDPETALRTATTKFRDRFSEVERMAAERGIDLATAGLVVLDQLWDEVKSRSG
jgi:tetrapyrrole methylase family protein / MazG family protein